MKTIKINDEWSYYEPLTRLSKAVASQQPEKLFIHTCKAPTVESIRVTYTYNTGNGGAMYSGLCLCCQTCNTIVPNEAIEKIQFLFNDSTFCEKYIAK